MKAEHRAKLLEKWEQNHNAEHRARAAAATSALGPLLSWVPGFFTWAGLTMATLPLLQLLPPEWAQRLIIVGYAKALPLYAIPYAVLILVVPRVMVSRGITRELKWVEALPFEVAGYEQALGRYPGRSRDRLEFVIEFVDAVPSKNDLAAYLDEGGVTWTLELSGNEADLERAPGVAQYHDDLNRRLLLWFRGSFVPKKLMSIHEKWPIKRFTFDSY